MMPNKKCGKLCLWSVVIQNLLKVVKRLLELNEMLTFDTTFLQDVGVLDIFRNPK